MSICYSAPPFPSLSPTAFSGASSSLSSSSLSSISSSLSPSPSSSSPTFSSTLPCSSSSSLSISLRRFFDKPNGPASGNSGGVLLLFAASLPVVGFANDRTPLTSLHLARDFLAPASFAGSPVIFVVVVIPVAAVIGVPTNGLQTGISAQDYRRGVSVLTWALPLPFPLSFRISTTGRRGETKLPPGEEPRRLRAVAASAILLRRSSNSCATASFCASSVAFLAASSSAFFLATAAAFLGLLSRHVPPPPTNLSVHDEKGLEEEDEDDIIRKAQERVERVRARKAVAAAKKAAEEKAARAAAARGRAAQEAREQALRARQQEEEVVERRRLLAEAATARSQRGTSPSEMSVSPRRPVVEIWRKTTSKGKGKAKAQPVGGDPDDDNKEDRAPCKRCKTKKLPCQMQAGKRSSIISTGNHHGEPNGTESHRPPGVMRGRLENTPVPLPAVEEAGGRPCPLDSHGGGSAMAGPSRWTTERRHPLKQRVVEESDKEDEEEKEKDVENGMEEDGEGEVEEEGGGMEAEKEGEGEAPAKTVASEKGKEKEVVE
ncbi:hypothetical protein F5877DRAFT_86481 [Lentinula edodes]|nr:hypothetical protein F5877DRAFT_86481 [Lentinula edodes]